MHLLKIKLQRVQRDTACLQEIFENFSNFKCFLKIHMCDTMYDKLCINPGYLSKRVERQKGKKIVNG